MVALRGLVPIVPTPFDGSGQLDLESLERVLDHLIESGAHGVAVLGMASEVITLTDQERLTVVEHAARHVAGRVPMVAGCSHISPEAVARFAAEFHTAGAEVLMVMPPSMGRPDDTALLDYFTAAADASPAAVMVQDNPGWHGVGLSLALYKKLAGHPNIRYAKIETGHPPSTISAVTAVAGGRLAIMGGGAGIWLPEELRRGAIGTMPGAIMPQVYRQIWDLWTSGDHERAVEVFDRHYALIRVTGAPQVGIPMTKELLASAGVIATATVRAPFRQLGVADADDLAAVITAQSQWISTSS